jgi:GTP-binding protein
VAPDELVECTPKNIRLRKRTLDSNQRLRERKKSEAEMENA